MQLRVARLCLDCEEIHDAQQCPVCASETFAFMTRWLPAPERRQAPRPPDQNAPESERLEAFRTFTRGRVLTGGALGLATLGVVSWWWRRGRKPRQAATREPAPESTQDQAPE
jgi:hypothetical protein